MVQERNLALYIILTIVTGGIFGLYWVYTLNEDTNALTMEEKPTSGGVGLSQEDVTVLLPPPSPQEWMAHSASNTWYANQ